MRALFLIGVLAALVVAYVVIVPSRNSAAGMATELAQAANTKVAAELSEVAKTKVAAELAQAANVPLEELVNAQLGDTKRQTPAEEAVAQYDLSQRRGNALDMCARAHRVVVAFLEANDQANYRAWKRRENVDCAKAGIPAQ
jgi:ribosome maturation factor RimP